MTDIDGARVLRESIPHGYISIAAGDESATSDWDGYESFDAPPFYVYKVYFGYFDLSGYTREQKTTFIRNVMFQNVGTPWLLDLETASTVEEARVLSTIPLEMSDFTQSSFGIHWELPGSPQSTFTPQEIVLGSSANYEMDVGAAVGRITDQSSWGLGDSTAGEKLYYARAFRFSRIQHGTATPSSYTAAFPAVVVAVPIIVGTEPDLEYIMRLKRSVELAE